MELGQGYVHKILFYGAGNLLRELATMQMVN